MLLSTSYSGEMEMLAACNKWKIKIVMIRPGLDTVTFGNGRRVFWMSILNQHAEPLQPDEDQTHRIARLQEVKDIPLAHQITLAWLGKTRDWTLGKVGMGGFDVLSMTGTTSSCRSKGKRGFDELSHDSKNSGKRRLGAFDELSHHDSSHSIGSKGKPTEGRNSLTKSVSAGRIGATLTSIPRVSSGSHAAPSGSSNSHRTLLDNARKQVRSNTHASRKRLKSNDASAKDVLGHPKAKNPTWLQNSGLVKAKNRTTSSTVPSTANMFVGANAAMRAHMTEAKLLGPNQARSVAIMFQAAARIRAASSTYGWLCAPNFVGAKKGRCDKYSWECKKCKKTDVGPTRLINSSASVCQNWKSKSTTTRDMIAAAHGEARKETCIDLGLVKQNIISAKGKKMRRPRALDLATSDYRNKFTPLPNDLDDGWACPTCDFTIAKGTPGARGLASDHLKLHGKKLPKAARNDEHLRSRLTAGTHEKTDWKIDQWNARAPAYSHSFRRFSASSVILPNGSKKFASSHAYGCDHCSTRGAVTAFTLRGGPSKKHLIPNEFLEQRTGYGLIIAQNAAK